MQELKATEKSLKNKNDFVIHEDVVEEKESKKLVVVETKPASQAVVPKQKIKEDKENNKNTDAGLELSDAVISVPRQPLKDLKVCTYFSYRDLITGGFT